MAKGGSMIVAVLKFEIEGDEQAPWSPKQLSQLKIQLKQRFKLSCGTKANGNGGATVAAAMIHHNRQHIESTLANMITTCEENGWGRIEESEILIEDLDKLFEEDHPE